MVWAIAVVQPYQIPGYYLVEAAIAINLDSEIPGTATLDLRPIQS